MYALKLVYALGIGPQHRLQPADRLPLPRGDGAPGAGAAALGGRWQHGGRTVLFSAATVTAALGALLLFPIVSISSMGLAGMMVTICSAITAVVVLPAVLALLGPAHRHPLRCSVAARPRRRPPIPGGGHGWPAGDARRPAVIALVVALVLLAAGTPALGRPVHRLLDQGLPASLQAVQVDGRPLSTDFGIRERGAAPAGRKRRAAAAAPGATPTRPRWLADHRGAVGVQRPVALGPGLWEVDATLERRVGRLDAASAGRGQCGGAHPRPFPVGRAFGYTASFIDFEASLVAHLPWAALLLAATTLVILFVMTGVGGAPRQGADHEHADPGRHAGAARPRLPERLPHRVAGLPTPGGHQPR